MRAAFLEAVEAISLALMTKVMGVKLEDVGKVVAAVTKDLKNPKYHVFNP